MRLKVGFQAALFARRLIKKRIALFVISVPTRHDVDVKVSAPFIDITALQPKSGWLLLNQVIILQRCFGIVVDILERFAGACVLVLEVTDDVKVVRLEYESAFGD